MNEHEKDLNFYLSHANHNLKYNLALKEILSYLIDRKKYRKFGHASSFINQETISFFVNQEKKLFQFLTTDRSQISINDIEINLQISCSND